MSRRVTPQDLPVEGAVLVDVREPGEFAAKRLAGSVNVPLSRLETEAAKLPKRRG